MNKPRKMFASYTNWTEVAQYLSERCESMSDDETDALVAETLKEVFEAGRERGFEEGYEEGHDAGYETGCYRCYNGH